MPKTSAAALAMPALLRREQARLVPPKHLTEAQCAMWRATVNALPPDYFRPEVAATLERYCIGVDRVRQLEVLLAEDDPAQDFDRYERIVRLAGIETARIAALARSLRITNQSRNAATAGRMAAGAQPARTAEDDAAAVAELVAWRKGPQ